MSVFDTIRDQVTLEQILSANGSNKTNCVAPDHYDQAPSMHLYGDHVHCFSCGFHGDVADVWAAMRGFDRPVEAALDLAREFGVQLPEVGPAARKRAQERRDKEDLYLRQAQACHRALDRHPRVRAWWVGRGFGEELQERFLLGTNKDGTAAVIPYWHRGRVQGLIRRKLEGKPKYIYPNAEEFPGGCRPLFIPAPLRASVFLVEGIVDALALAALGESSAAVGGAGASERQMQELANWPAPHYILPDADKAGAEAGRKLVRALYPKARQCPPRYGAGLKDVADLYRLRGEETRTVLEGLKADAVGALELELSEVSSRDDSLGAYRLAKERILPLLLQLEDEGEQDAALRDVARRLDLGLRQLRKALASCREGEEEEPEAEPQKPEVAAEVVEELVGCPGVLSRYVQDAATIHGVVGEREHLKLLTLNAVGAQLAPLPNGRPSGANLLLTAEAGRGKNHLADAVSGLLPEDFYIAFESASEKSLYYKAEKNPDLLRHAWIYPNEAEATDQLVEMFRPLISGGHASHLTVNKDAEGRNAAQEFKVEGPVTITIPTVRNKLDTQLQTRMLVSELPDYAGRVAAHSRAFSRLLLPNHAGEDHTPKRRAWQAALRSLAAIRRVVFDLERQEFCFDSDTVSHGARLWGNLLGLMLAHAWLEQKSREIIELPSGELAVVATPEDYEAAYNVFKGTCERSVVNLSDTHRKILDAVYVLKGESNSTEGFSHRKIAERAGTHHSTVGEHRTYLSKSVKLLRETESGMLDLVADAEPSWWNDDDLLEGFPHPEKVWRWWEGKEHHCAPESARHARHPDAKAREPRRYAEGPGGHLTRQPSATISHTDNARPVAGREAAAADKAPAAENGAGKPISNGSGELAGVAGASEHNSEKTSGNGSRDMAADVVSVFLANPPAWYRRQAEQCARQESPERLLKPLASAVAYQVLGNANRWSEVLPHVEAELKERNPA